MEKATQEIIEVLKEKGINFVVNHRDAAFYGPKADIIVKTLLEENGKQEQSNRLQPTRKIQLRICWKRRTKHRPVMIHRAPFGSFERFTGIIIEHFGGNFPLWLSPEQVRIIPISEKFMEYAKQVKTKLLEAEIRVKLDERNETLGYKIRDAQKNKTPYALIIGAKEVENKTISLRDRKGKQETIGLEEFLDKIVKEIKEKN